MGTLLGYIKNIGFFLILVSVVCNVLPDNSYKKYCKLFCGLVLVVLVMTPVNEFLNYDGNISDIFIGNTYEAERMELEANLKRQEEDNFQMVLDQYENEVKNVTANIARDEGLYVDDVVIGYNENEYGELELQKLQIHVGKITELYEENIYSHNSDIKLDEIHIDDIKIQINQEGDDKSGIDNLSPGDRPGVIRFVEKVSSLLNIDTVKIYVYMNQ